MQTFQGRTRLIFPYFVHHSVAPSIHIVRGKDWSQASSDPLVEWSLTPPSIFSPVPRIRHPWPSWTYGSVRAWRRSTCRCYLSFTSCLFLLLLSPLLLADKRPRGNTLITLCVIICFFTSIFLKFRNIRLWFKTTL